MASKIILVNNAKMGKGSAQIIHDTNVSICQNNREEMFGTVRMIEALNEAHTESPDRILKHVREGMDAFVKDAEQFDDLTMLCFEYRGPQEENH